MGFGRQQHVAETAEHMGADRLALIGAADRPHTALVSRHAEMVRPEPDQPLDKADLGTDRGVKASFGLVEIKLLRHARTRILAWLIRWFGHVRRRILRRGGAAFCTALGRHAFRLSCGPLRPLIREGSPRGCAAAQ
jgi:hypothetical protein